MKTQRWRLLILGGLAMLTAMVVVFIAIKESGYANWSEVEAKVISSEIKSYRTGAPPEWALFVTIGYTVASKRYDGNSLRVYSNPKWEITKAEQSNWPPGRTFSVYHHPDNPKRTSLTRDGGREGLAVVAAMFVPLVISLCGLGIILVRRRLRSTTQ